MLAGEHGTLGELTNRLSMSSSELVFWFPDYHALDKRLSYDLAVTATFLPTVRFYGLIPNAGRIDEEYRIPWDD